MVDGCLFSNETVSVFSTVIKQNYPEVTIGLTNFLVGFLILFYLIRIDDKIDFLDTELETWEKITWIFALGLINVAFSILVWGASTALSATILVVFGLTEYSQYLASAMFPLLIISFLLLPAVLYRDFLTKQFESRGVQPNVVIELFLVSILGLSVGNYLLFWGYYNIHDFKVLLIVILLTIIALKLHTPLIRKTIGLIIWLIRLPFRIMGKVVDFIRS